MEYTVQENMAFMRLLIGIGDLHLFVIRHTGSGNMLPDAEIAKLNLRVEDSSGDALEFGFNVWKLT